MAIVDLFIIGGNIGMSEVILHPVTAAARLWCSSQHLGEWTQEVLRLSVADHIEAIVPTIPDHLQTMTM